MTATARDRAAEARDRAAKRREDTVAALAGPDAPIAAVLAAGAAIRRQAVADRDRAAQDRRRAAADRAQSAADRPQARVDLARAHTDSLTGVFLRELGLVTIEHEIDRARRSGAPFSLAYIDIDGLKQRNDAQGHAAGDDLLKTVVGALRAALRPYDPIVRIGGDEFLCGLVDTELDASRRRMQEIQALVRAGPAAGTISVGLAALKLDGTLEELIAEADRDIYRRKRPRPPS
jgi:diguanylate cyclase (GGDEF)-like protein